MGSSHFAVSDYGRFINSHAPRIPLTGGNRGSGTAAKANRFRMKASTPIRWQAFNLPRYPDLGEAILRSCNYVLSGVATCLIGVTLSLMVFIVRLTMRRSVASPPHARQP